MKKANKKNLLIEFFKKTKRFFLNLSNFKIILIVYALIVLLFAILLILPISKKPNVSISFIDSLFTTASAFSDTGLTTHPIVDIWNDFGYAIISILILLGGVGIFAFKVYIVNVIFGRRISLISRNILEKERSASNTGDIQQTIKVSLSILIVCILLSAFVLMFLFYFESGNFVGDEAKYNPKGNWLLSFKYAIFHSISAINNAGFDILSSGNSLSSYYGVFSIQIVFIILLVIGGIGYPVIYDIYQYISHKIRKRTDFQFSLFTKISCITYFLVFAIGLILTFIFETTTKNGIWKLDDMGTSGEKIMTIIFHVFSTRNAGFTTTDLNHSFTSPSIVLFSIMMFIGSAPSSTAGGIRTTTLAIIILAIWNKIRGIDDVRVFKRRITRDTIYSSFLVLGISLFLVFVNIFICFTSLETMWGSAPVIGNPNSEKIFSFDDILFEVTSAFGTTGLSTGLTPYLNIGSKIFLMILMFIGQLGVSSTILLWKTNKNNKKDYDYIEENLIIG